MLNARLIASLDLAPEVRQFDFEVTGQPKLHFSPGQFVSVVHNVNGKDITRAYSIASPPDEAKFSLCLNRVSDGLVSPFLFGLSVGDEIGINEPLGYFTLRHPGRRILLVATGTGIAPFRSILLHHLPEVALHATLLFGVRYETGLLYSAEFTLLAEKYPGFRFMPTVSRPAESWVGRTGRVTAHLAEALESLHVQDLSTVDVYICGLKEMVNDVRSYLKAKGLDRKQIIYEKYD